jgi:sulfur-oxidizing protein SoxB
MPSPALISKSALRFGKLGGFAHLKTLVDRLRSDVSQGAAAADGSDSGRGPGSPTP